MLLFARRPSLDGSLGGGSLSASPPLFAKAEKRTWLPIGACAQNLSPKIFDKPSLASHAAIESQLQGGPCTTRIFAAAASTLFEKLWLDGRRRKEEQNEQRSSWRETSVGKDKNIALVVAAEDEPQHEQYPPARRAIESSPRCEALDERPIPLGREWRRRGRRICGCSGLHYVSADERRCALGSVGRCRRSACGGYGRFQM